MFGGRNGWLFNKASHKLSSGRIFKEMEIYKKKLKIKFLIFFLEFKNGIIILKKKKFFFSFVKKCI